MTNETTNSAAVLNGNVPTRGTSRPKPGGGMLVEGVRGVAPLSRRGHGELTDKTTSHSDRVQKIRPAGPGRDDGGEGHPEGEGVDGPV